MELFRISVTMENKNALKEEFVAYFLKRKYTNIIRGCLEKETNRYIEGIYEGNQIAFMVLSNTGEIPIAFSFPCINEEGYWSEYRNGEGFFEKRMYHGCATIKFQKISEREKLKEVAKKFDEEAQKAGTLNRHLMNYVRELADYYSIDSVRFPAKKIEVKK